jgi:hypothetical protein
MKIITESLRCAESFHKRPRFDTCLVRLPDGTHAIARLRMIFTCKADGTEWKVARVTLFKTVKSAHAVTGMRHVKEEKPGFIMLSWIIRSVFLSPTFEKASLGSQGFFVNDLIDSEDDVSDIYLRLRDVPDGSWF